MKTEPKFAVKERVRILPCLNYPPTKAPSGIRYGIVQAATDRPGMHLQNTAKPYPAEPAVNHEGEWAYAVSLTPNGGALWFTAEGLQPLRNR